MICKVKAAITGYITAVINNYTRAVENLKKNKAPAHTFSKYQTIIEELNDLLDFIEDLPEEKHESIIITFDGVDIHE